jgi:hypothetical protein
MRALNNFAWEFSLQKEYVKRTASLSDKLKTLNPNLSTEPKKMTTK